MVREEETIATLVKNLHAIIIGKICKIEDKNLSFIIELTDLIIRIRKNGCKFPQNAIDYLLKMNESPEFLSELDK